MPRRAAPLPDSLRGPFRTDQARALGVSARRLRASDLEQPFRGVHRRRAPEPPIPDADTQPFAQDRAQRARVLREIEAYLPVMSARSFFVGRTAAVMHGLPVAASAALEVGVLAPRRAPRRQGIAGRMVDARLVSVATVDGIRLSSPASTWAMLADALDVRELVVAGDAIVHVPRDARAHRRPERALGTIAQLQAALDAGRRRGVAKLREALPLIRVGSASPLETEYRLDAAAAGLPEPLLDVEIRTPGGVLLGITEIAYPQWRTVVEIEGDHHRTSRRQWNRDIEKYASYAAEGWEVVRLTSAHVRGRHPRAVRVVREVLTRRGWMPDAGPSPVTRGRNPRAEPTTGDR